MASHMLLYTHMLNHLWLDFTPETLLASDTGADAISGVVSILCLGDLGKLILLVLEREKGIVKLPSCLQCFKEVFLQ